MTITNTMISDLVPSEKILGGTVDLLLKAENELVTTGLVAQSPDLDARAAVARKPSIPFLKPLDTTAVNRGGEDITVAGSVGKMQADEYTAIRHDLNYGWGTADLVQMVTQYDAKGGIGAGITDYWNGIYQKHAAFALKGALGADAGLTFGDGTAAFSLDLLIDAAATANMYANLFDIMIVSPVTYAKLQKMNGGQTFQHKSDTKLKFDMFGQYKVIRSMAFGNTETILARSGGLAFADVQPSGIVPLAIERVENGANGQGGDILHSRRSVVIHPQGFSWLGGVSPDYTGAGNLDDVTKWELAVPLEQVGFRLVKHTA